MKIYLKNLETKDWELHEGTLEQLKPELDLRNIFISSTARIGDGASIGDYARIGDRASIGKGARIEKREE